MKVYTLYIGTIHNQRQLIFPVLGPLTPFENESILDIIYPELLVPDLD